MSNVIYHDKCFMMDPPSRFLDTPNAGNQTDIMQDRLTKKMDIPIYSCALDKRCPDVIEYPLQEVIHKTGYAYFNNTVAYAIAYAIAQDVSHTFIWNRFYIQRLAFAEAGRACCEFWLAIAIARKIKIHIANNSSLLDMNIPDDQKLYGYHRLDDPLVSTATNGNMLITKKSKIKSTRTIGCNT